MSPGGAAARIVATIEALIGAPAPIAIAAWDGSRAGPDDGPVVVVRSRRALRRLLWQPDEVGLGRAWVTGELDVTGDLEEALRRLDSVTHDVAARTHLSAGERAEILRTAVLLGAVGPAPKPPPEEIELSGARHSRLRDRAAVSHHYDVGNDFYAIVLGDSMVYSCAYWARPDDPAYTLDDAQRDKLDLVCRKLGLQPGMRLLDVGCGWGGLVRHAAREYGVTALGITLSRQQAEYATRLVEDEGLAGQVEIRVQDWRELDEAPFDAIASVGMAEHVGAQGWPDYAARLHGLLVPGGRLLNHQIARVPSRGLVRRPGRRSFIDAYVFPDGDLLPLADVVGNLEGAGFEVRDVHGLREHYSRTLRTWVTNLEAAWPRAVELAGAGRARVWRLYLTGSALSFDAGRIGVHQVLAVKAHADGRSDMPTLRPL